MQSLHNNVLSYIRRGRSYTTYDFENVIFHHMYSEISIHYSKY